MEKIYCLSCQGFFFLRTRFENGFSILYKTITRAWKQSFTPWHHNLGGANILFRGPHQFLSSTSATSLSSTSPRWGTCPTWGQQRWMSHQGQDTYCPSGCTGHPHLPPSLSHQTPLGPSPHACMLLPLGAAFPTHPTLCQITNIVLWCEEPISEQMMCFQ